MDKETIHLDREIPQTARTASGSPDDLTYGHFISVFGLVLMQQEVAQELFCIVGADSIDLDFEMVFIPMMPHKHIVVFWGVVFVYCIGKFQNV